MNWYELEILNTKNMNYKTEYDRSDSNSGFDLFSADMTIQKQVAELIPFGIVARLIKVEQINNISLKTDSHFWLLPRSSIYKSGLIMANSTGVIDKSYRGELKAPVWSMIDTVTISQNERHFQIVAPDMGWIRNVRIVDSMPYTERGEGGFGSSGV